jgi:hypothetical protein
MIEIPEDVLGPKMRALRTDLQRRFCWLMASGMYNPTDAARQVGYSDAAEGRKVQAHRLMHDPRVLDALEEATKATLKGLGPVAVRRAKEILDDRKHPYHGRMVEGILDRAGYAPRTEHSVRVEHSVDVRELEELARRLAAETGVSATKFLGVNEAPVIEGEALEVELHDDDSFSKE